MPYCFSHLFLSITDADFFIIPYTILSPLCLEYYKSSRTSSGVLPESGFQNVGKLLCYNSYPIKLAFFLLFFRVLFSFISSILFLFSDLSSSFFSRPTFPLLTVCHFQPSQVHDLQLYVTTHNEYFVYINIKLVVRICSFVLEYLFCHTSLHNLCKTLFSLWLCFLSNGTFVHALILTQYIFAFISFSCLYFFRGWFFSSYLSNVVLRASKHVIPVSPESAMNRKQH